MLFLLHTFTGVAPGNSFKSSAVIRQPPIWSVHVDTLPEKEPLILSSEGSYTKLAKLIQNLNRQQESRPNSALRAVGPAMLEELGAASRNVHIYLDAHALQIGVPSQEHAEGQERAETMQKRHGQYLPWYRYHKKIAPSQSSEQ